jgi:hypothetical protein
MEYYNKLKLKLRKLAVCIDSMTVLWYLELTALNKRISVCVLNENAITNE